jgi:hypothetical protein
LACAAAARWRARRNPPDRTELEARSFATYWLLTHPVNNFWLKSVKMKGTGKHFFSAGPLRRIGPGDADWAVLRDRWELSHLIRAVFGMLGLVLLVTAVALRPGTP